MILWKQNKSAEGEEETIPKIANFLRDSVKKNKSKKSQTNKIKLKRDDIGSKGEWKNDCDRSRKEETALSSQITPIVQSRTEFGEMNRSIRQNNSSRQ